MQGKTLKHVLCRTRTDARLHSLRASQQLRGLVERGLARREVRWLVGLDSECEALPVHGILHGACEAE